MSKQGLVAETTGLGPICWVVALKPEASSILNRYQLVPDNRTKGPFRIWKNRDEDHWLVISGVGKAKASAAVEWLFARAGEPASAVWINAGIAGHGTSEPGVVKRICKITDAATGRDFFPADVPGSELEDGSLLTVDQPVDPYPEDGSLVDMEGAGFFASASRLSGEERVQSIKVVSDNPENGYRALTSARVKELMGELVQQSEGLVRQFT